MIWDDACLIYLRNFSAKDKQQAASGSFIKSVGLADWKKLNKIEYIIKPCFLSFDDG